MRPAAMQGIRRRRHHAPAGRVHITWQDDDTLKRRARRRHADAPARLRRRTAPVGEKTWQGFRRPNGSGRRARAARPCARRRQQPGPIAPGGGAAASAAVRRRTAALNEGGSLKVVTTNFREGYLRKNGVPYSENASITEYFHRLPRASERRRVAARGDDRRRSEVSDEPFYTSTHFKLEPNGAKWNPTPCRTAPPPPVVSAPAATRPADPLPQ